MTVGQLSLAVEMPQPAWAPPKSKGACTRNPAAGPGSCWHWWELCPHAAQRGCYQLWAKSQDKAAAHPQPEAAA